MAWTADIQPISGTLDPERFGARAGRLSAFAAAGGQVPQGCAISVAQIQRFADSPQEARSCAELIAQELAGQFPLAIRSSPQQVAWGGPDAVMNIGMADTAPWQQKFAFIRDFAVAVEALDATQFADLQKRAVVENNAAGLRLVAAAETFFQSETGTTFPWDPVTQIERVILALSADWTRPSARILREANGAPADAGLGFVVHHYLHLFGPADGFGQAQGIDPTTGAHAFECNIFRADQSKADIDMLSPEAVLALKDQIAIGNNVLRDASQVSFVLTNGQATIIDLIPAKRSSFAEIQTAVDLVDADVLSQSEAVLRVNPQSLLEHLHPQIAEDAPKDVLGRGIAASPGAAHGRIVLSAQAAQAAAAQDERAILVRVETSPEDIRGMNSAAGVVTLTGGLSSHAAVIAQGLGVPCVVGARNMRIDVEARTLTTDDGRLLREGDIVTLNGNDGTVLAGALQLKQSELSPAFRTLMTWADDIRAMGVRANADTPQDARVAKRFLVDGIGLCRTEHMFYEAERIDVMREMILTDEDLRRRKALERLLPMQRADFQELFAIMEGAPVTVRLLDPPLHEFLPRDGPEIAALAASMDLSVTVVRRRIEDLGEFNPMLGMRGVRLAIIMPEIYEMQARAVFEAAIEAGRVSGKKIVPEIMIPLVSAQREVELVKDRIAGVAEEVEAQLGEKPEYKIGVMVETPRAALRAGDMAASSAFLSFGTNDLTQMAYGLSRDDAGRFMREYVQVGVFPEDPFLTLDVEGVGELLLTAARRGRASNPDIELGLCGEHGGDPTSVQFCKIAGFDYVSCSPFRVPIARLAAAQATLLDLSINAQGDSV